jgi:DNA polymerase/3'-5' exonuclease PolX
MIYESVIFLALHIAMTEALLAKIPGIGEKTASRYAPLVPGEIRSLSALRKALCALGPADFAHLPVSTQADLKYQPLHRMPRALIDIVNDELRGNGKQRKFDIGGSYRREKPVSGDLDIVFSGSRADWDAFAVGINEKSKRVCIMEPFAGHEDKLTVYMRVKLPAALLGKVLSSCAEDYHDVGRIRKSKSVYIKADIFLTTPKEYAFALLFVTGSGKFNIRMRRVAKMRGYLLNQHGLYRKTSDGSGIIEPIAVKSEKDLFNILGMTYKEPRKRIQ